MKGLLIEKLVSRKMALTGVAVFLLNEAKEYGALAAVVVVSVIVEAVLAFPARWFAARLPDSARVNPTD